MKSNKGFTLIELLALIVILAITLSGFVNLEFDYLLKLYLLSILVF